jgi:hypothetical protein
MSIETRNMSDFNFTGFDHPDMYSSTGILVWLQGTLMQQLNSRPCLDVSDQERAYNPLALSREGLKKLHKMKIHMLAAVSDLLRNETAASILHTVDLPQTASRFLLYLVPADGMY